MQSTSQFKFSAAATVLIPLLLGGCASLPSVWDAPSQDAATSNQPENEKFDRDLPTMDTDSFMNGFAGSLGGR